MIITSRRKNSEAMKESRGFALFGPAHNYTSAACGNIAERPQPVSAYGANRRKEMKSSMPPSTEPIVAPMPAAATASDIT